MREPSRLVIEGEEDLRPADETHFQSSLVHVGSFRCPIGHPDFHAVAPTRGYCFVFPRTAVWIHQEGRRPFVADANVVPLYNPSRPYRRHAISPDGDRTDWFGVSPNVLRDMVRAFDGRHAEADVDLFAMAFGRAHSGLYLAQRQIYNRVRAGACDALFVDEQVIGLLADVLRAAYGHRSSPVESPRRHRELVEQTRALLARAAHEPLSLSRLARAVGASPFHLCRVFKALTGRTMHAYRGQLRLRRSLELLAGEGCELLDVALALGYSSHSHFSQAFRRAFGLTPSAFRSEAASHGARALRARTATAAQRLGVRSRGRLACRDL